MMRMRKRLWAQPSQPVSESTGGHRRNQHRNYHAFVHVPAMAVWKIPTKQRRNFWTGTNCTQVAKKRLRKWHWDWNWSVVFLCAGVCFVSGPKSCCGFKVFQIEIENKKGHWKTHWIMSYLSMAMVFCVDDLPVETPQKGLQRNFSHLERWISQRCSIHRIWGKIQLVSMLHLHNFAYILSYVIHVCHILPYFVMFCKEHVIYQLKKKTWPVSTTYIYFTVTALEL